MVQTITGTKKRCRSAGVNERWDEMIYRIYTHNGFDFEWTPHTVEARSVAEARKIWAAKGAPSETWKFRVSRERKAA